MAPSETQRSSSFLDHVRTALQKEKTEDDPPEVKLGWVPVVERGPFVEYGASESSTNTRTTQVSHPPPQQPGWVRIEKDASLPPEGTKSTSPATTSAKISRMAQTAAASAADRLRKMLRVGPETNCDGIWQHVGVKVWPNGQLCVPDELGETISCEFEASGSASADCVEAHALSQLPEAFVLEVGSATIFPAFSLSEASTGTAPFILGKVKVSNFRLLFLPASNDGFPLSVPYSVPLQSIRRLQACLQPPHLAIHMLTTLSALPQAWLMRDDQTASIVQLMKLFRHTFEGSGDMTESFAWRPKPAEASGAKMAKQWLNDDMSRFLAISGGLKCRETKANAGFRLTPSYPEAVLVPEAMSDIDVEMLADGRAKGRFPVMCWKDAKGLATLWRCAQPLSAYQRLPMDEKFFGVLTRTLPNSDGSVIICDARPYLNALANKIVGAGYESVPAPASTAAAYSRCSIFFANIPNVQDVARSHLTMEKAIVDGAAGKLPSLSDGNGRQYFLWNDRPNFFRLMNQSLWYSYISSVLHAACRIAHALVEEKVHVVVHCSDGWDRASQLTALAKLLIDPTYRTLKGFCTLIETEFCHFGHRFQSRLGLPIGVPMSPETTVESGISEVEGGAMVLNMSVRSAAKGGAESPVFMQFLECVFQIMEQHPAQFTFSTEVLLVVCHHVHTGLFGNFVGDNEQQRTKCEIARNTLCLWETLVDRFPDDAAKTPSGEILVDSYPGALKVWHDYWYRGTPIGMARRFRRQLLLA